MKSKRIHIRVPVAGGVFLESKLGAVIKASALDISESGIGVSELSDPPENAEYTIKVTTISHGEMQFSGVLVHIEKNKAGFVITNINSENLKILKNLIGSFQATDDFIKYIDKYDILRDWFKDKEGNEIDLTFELPDPEESVVA